MCALVGRYEWPPSAYKHFYFNSTYSMLAVWFVVVTGIILLYECVRYIIPLVYYSRCLLRHEMLALFVSSLYPHYYGWWGLINYINEDFYAQWKHQVCYDDDNKRCWCWRASVSSVRNLSIGQECIRYTGRFSSSESLREFHQLLCHYFVQ